ncbi:ComF family protein [Konateibacter massiliensis]|uniref:ComF family protein n=1 Tax=Konateibacter massiliensis TaxID=2002841 RepID=UPI000C158441|nr:ComF family protein [Konateibacter massiliensis]
MNDIKWLVQITEGVLNILYPHTCPICGRIPKVDRAEVCPECKKKIKYIEEPSCKKCGKQLLAEEQEYCYDCSKREHIYTRGLALWVYGDEIRKSIYNFKYNNKREYARVYANEIVLRHRRKIESWNADALIPIPIHQSKMRSRGFNQAEDLCRELSKQLGVPVLSDCIKREKKTLPQKGLNDKQRIKNLKKAFKTMNNDVELKRVILVDDIYTTGATINSVAELLENMGVYEIYFITISIGEGI